MEVLGSTKILADQCGTANCSIRVQEQTAVGLARKEGLTEAPNQEWISPATKDPENQRGHNRGPNLREDGFHRSNQFQRGNQDIDGFDPDEGNNDAT